MWKHHSCASSLRSMLAHWGLWIESTVLLWHFRTKCTLWFCSILSVCFGHSLLVKLIFFFLLLSTHVIHCCIPNDSSRRNRQLIILFFDHDLIVDWLLVLSVHHFEVTGNCTWFHYVQFQWVIFFSQINDLWFELVCWDGNWLASVSH